MSPVLSPKYLQNILNITSVIHGSYSRSYSTIIGNRCAFRKILETGNNRSKLSNGTVIRWFKRNPNARIGLTPFQKVTEEPENFRKLLKPFLFTIGVCGASYVGSVIWQYENLRSEALRQLREHKIGLFKKPLNYKQGEFRRHLNAWWNSLSEGEQLAIEIISLNTLVFGAWRIKGFKRVMIKYFTSNPSSKSVCLPMMLSTFSHFSLFHLAANMYVLFSFSGITGKLFGKEQFLGFYLSAGVVSSFASYIHKIATKSLSPSLGASGALMAILAPICVKYPDAKISIVFLPFFTFSAGAAIACVMGVDALGLILGWRFFDHAAHLGGALFGIGYLYLGQDHIWKNREPIMMWWHKLRESVKK